MQIRMLTVNDLPQYKAMQTHIKDDYMIDIFEHLITPPNHALFGLFKDDRLVSVAGYSFFPGGYAMLGRLRSDRREHGNGYATTLLVEIINRLKVNQHVDWIGGYTNINNQAARRVLAKLQFEPLKTFHSYPLINRQLVNSKVGDIWNEVYHLKNKRAILDQLAADGVLDVYPYECYYPFPFQQALLPDQKLDETRVFQNKQQDRWLFISNDYKKEPYAHVRYFWDDHFNQAGLFETIDYYLSQQDEPRKPWFDFSTYASSLIPNLDAFEIQDGWILYGKSV
ncbi:GNAT family N-acetyltransferase [Amphibacillus cookii]|uniref:GNAT family N-acetyltransferase n=1 Tax=Amphibacillus cookii TaxID=767787 RepID=UPI00195DB4E4|nr:GNAT family N-acetyltransferase [Amphibacillus cookii]MBM7540119.1 RimJ/RimL family protein N-acetyltransferase [Amphibacillus cookii]